MFTKRSEYEREGTCASFSSLCARFIANCVHRASFLSAFVFSDEDSAYPFRDTCCEIRPCRKRKEMKKNKKLRMQKEIFD